MFFTLSKVFAMLALPYPLFLLLIFVFLIRRPFERKWLLVAWLVIVFCSTNIGAGSLISTLENKYPSISESEAHPADAIVVLGGLTEAGHYKHQRPEFLSSVDRLLYALELQRLKKAPILFISGGSGTMAQSGIKEGQVLKEFIEKRKMSHGPVLTETVSRNTRENAVETAKILKARGSKSILLVTSAFHMLRSVPLFEKEGFTVHPFPVDFKASENYIFPEDYMPTPHGLSKFSKAVREYIGLVAYWVAGYTR